MNKELNDVQVFFDFQQSELHHKAVCSAEIGPCVAVPEMHVPNL